ncbi:MAG: hypothetical protein ABIT64_03150 [Lysobacteraceae bacterium]
MTAITKIDIAKMQLDRGISLYLDQSDFVSAITLARASHELIRRLGESVTGVRDKGIDAFADLVVAISDQEGERTTTEDVVDRIFHFPNQLKHHGTGDADVLDANWPEEASDIIELAISAWFRVTQTMTDEMMRFDQARRA